MSKNSLTVGFSGDLSFSGYFAGHHTDNELFDASVKGFLDANDYNVINFESPVTPCRITKKKRLAHRSPTEALGFVKTNIKNPVLSFANNHMMDYGPIGVVDTIDACKAYDIPYLGIGLNLSEAARYTVLGDEVKVAVLSIQYKKNLIASETNGGPLHESSTEMIRKKIEKMKENADYAVVVYHGGDEFLHTPMPYTRRQLKQYLAWGADVVVAHHPHVVQGFEPVGDNKAIFYCLGNFVFDTDYQRVQQDTDNGILLRLTFTKKGFEYTYMPTHIDKAKGKVTIGSDTKWFKDIRKGYGKAWSCEARRKAEIMDNAAKLKEREAEALELVKETERVRLEAIENAAELKKAAMEASDAEIAEAEAEEETEAEAAKHTYPLYTFNKNLYKALIVNRAQKKKSAVVKIGALKAKILYRK